MINHFLATLDNIATPPSNFIWPSFTPRQIGNIEATVRAAVIGVNLSREQTFSRCLLLTDLVAQSPLSSYITAVDSRLTYSRVAIQSRFAASGPIVQYTGNEPATAAELNFQALPGSPDIDAWVFQPLSSSQMSIVDDRGASVVVAITFTNGVSNPILLPNGGGQVLFQGTGVETNDSWSLSYRAPGATWVADALARMSTMDPRGIMTPDILTWYDQSLVQLDKLAAVVAALGTL